ncbi:AAA family ATPase [Clostridium algidicarnis]|uniref:AAA family ATPase n=1 Tax=Clostridium algidicarnis TaxID=37659 RepID=UPI001C0C17B6|nr:AAA family ATPase [Clostridium algidicarnis]MBU3226777.1 AAA family ATPase [Clostridium algidicarnis]MBU3250312.1 AAA family ATPase [Clostridium algidicarnis]
MKHIELKSLKLKNFKGIKDLKIDFSRVTDIYGENATGKTTIADSFMWLLFDKDSKDRSTFDIKTLDSNNQPLHGLEHEVTGTLNVDGKDIELSKIYKEKWTKKRGEAEKELTGHETLYSIDEIPVKKKEYQDKINNLIDENLFKLITNPLYFSTNMKWQDRRKSLLEVIGDLTDEEVINYKSDLKQLGELLAEKDIDTLKKSVQAKKRRFNDDIKAIPIRIDEANNSIQDLDFEALEFEKRGIVSAIKSIEEQLLDSSKVNQVTLNENDKLYKLKEELQRLEYEAKVDINKPLRDIEIKISNHRAEISQLENEKFYKKKRLSVIKSSIKDFTEEMTRLRNQFGEVNKKVLEINENEFICPTCKREFETEDIEVKKQEMIENYNQNKSNALRNIQSEGVGYRKEVEKLSLEVSEIEEDLKSLELKIVAEKNSFEDLESFKVNFKPAIIETEEMKSLKDEIEALEIKFQQPISVNNADLKNKKYQLESELDGVNKKLNYKDTNGKLKQRMKELQEEERRLAQQIAQLEGQEYLCEEFVKAKVELLESSINSKFKFVSFKLFNTQVNGGIEETCEALIDGVPFSNANTASQINAGLDIINTLCSHYGVQAPIFIDNRESVNQLIETNSQVINLIVSKDKNLKVEVM